MRLRCPCQLIPCVEINRSNPNARTIYTTTVQTGWTLIHGRSVEIMQILQQELALWGKGWKSLAPYETPRSGTPCCILHHHSFSPSLQFVCGRELLNRTIEILGVQVRYLSIHLRHNWIVWLVVPAWSSSTDHQPKEPDLLTILSLSSSDF